MANFAQLAGVAAAAIYLVSGIPYIKEILQRRTKPNIASWWIWGINGTVLAAAHFAAGGRESFWLPLVYAIDPFIIALLALKYGQGGWDLFDRACLLGAILSMVLWWQLDNPVAATLTSIAIDSFAMAPTLRKWWWEPKSESALSWRLAFLANLINILAINKWEFGIAAYPVYLVALTFVGAFMTLRQEY